jgi:excisionase family DNA binding protein
MHQIHVDVRVMLQWVTFVTRRVADHVIFFTRLRQVETRKMADLLTTNQVQTLLQVDRTTIYRMVEGGQLPAIRVGKQWRFSRPDIERWLHAQTSASSGTESAASASQTRSAQAVMPSLSSPARPPAMPALRDLLPIACVQLIQDEFADLLGVMMVITDMQGQAITTVSNPCGFYTALIQGPDGADQCVRGWQQLAANPAIQPVFVPNEMGMLCARGLIRVGSELKGMVVIGGIAPEVWPPHSSQIALLAETFDLNASDVQANTDAVYRLDGAGQARALRAVQRIADIFSHIAGDRNSLWDRMQAIASLASI